MNCRSRRILPAVALGAAVLVAAGCGEASGPAASSPTASDNGSAIGDQLDKVSQGEQDAEAACTAALSKSADRSTARPLGQTYRYQDGLAIQLADQHPDVVAPYASGAYPGEPVFVVTLHLTNGTKAGLSTSGLEVKAAYDKKGLDQLGLSEVAQIDDTRTRTKKLPDVIPSSRSGTALLEFLAPERCVNRLIFQVTLDEKHPGVRFTAAAG
jgi:hypothetical protein